MSEAIETAISAMRRVYGVTIINMTRSVQRKSKFDANRCIRQLQKSQRALEVRVAALEKKGSPEAVAEALRGQFKARKRGRKPSMPNWAYSFRDQLVDFIESYWPELEHFLVPQQFENLRTLLECASKHLNGSKADAARHLAQHFDPLTAFLSSDRFRKDPRQIANALAGVPYVGWWRSLKNCGSQPCAYGIGLRATHNYLTRKFPSILPELTLAKSTIDVGIVMHRVRTKDREIRNLKLNPHLVLRVFEECKPNFEALVGKAALSELRLKRSD
jgi:hypothetical protein